MLGAVVLEGLDGASLLGGHETLVAVLVEIHEAAGMLVAARIDAPAILHLAKFASAELEQLTLQSRTASDLKPDGAVCVHVNRGTPAAGSNHILPAVLIVDDRVVTRIALVAQPGIGVDVGEHVTWDGRKVVFIARAGFR